MSRLNAYTLEFESTIKTNHRKANFGNCFVICTTLYCTGHYNEPRTNTTLVLDMFTGQELTLRLPFVNAHRYNSMLSYNPADRKIYSWDNGRLLTYDVIFQNNTLAD